MHLGWRQQMLTVTRFMPAAPEVAWRVLTDLDAWPRWGPTVQHAELAEPAPLRLGSRGTVWAPLGVALLFEITEFDDGHAWAWQVAGLPATRHAVTAADGGCLVTFEVPIWAPPYLAVCALALSRIEALALA
jgi:polyketide cyclase/dehydrase/lipid transport protein